MAVRAFAAHLGKSVQWARKLKRENAAEWQAWNARRVEVAAPPPVKEVEVLRAPDDDLQRAVAAKERAWHMFCKAAEAAEQGSSVLVEQVALNRAAKEAREVYEKACKHAAAALVESQQWVSIERVASIRAAMRQLEDVVQNWETTLAGALPDSMRPAFHRAFQESRPAWNQGVRALDSYIQTLLPVPC
jgi:hypothetical protein